MEKENEELLYKTTQGSDEMNALREENENMRLSHAKLEKDFLKLKREVCYMCGKNHPVFEFKYRHLFSFDFVHGMPNMSFLIT